MEKAKILVVEDERVVAMALQDRLELMGHQVVGNVATAERAIESAAAEKPDLALMDICLAGELDGVDAARILRERFNVPSVFLTAYADHATLERAKLTEPFGYLVKPFDARMLEATIEVALYRKRLENQRDRARDELRSSEARYRNLAQLSPVGIFECDAAIAYGYVNERWCAIAGIPAEEALGDGWMRAIHAEDRDRVLAAWRQSLSKGMELVIEHRFARPDGSAREVLTQALPQADGYVGTVTDLTELRNTQERLHRSERQLRVVADHLPVLFLSVDASLHYRFASGNTEPWYGIPADDFPGRTVREVVGETIFERLLPHLERVLAGNRHEFDFTLMTADGHRRWKKVCLVPDVDPSGSVVGYFSLALDVTALKEQEEARQRSDVRYAAILNNSPDAIISVDDSDLIVVFNKGAERAFGFAAAEAVGHRLDILVPGPGEGDNLLSLARLARDDANSKAIGMPNEIVGRRKTGERFPAEAVIVKTEHDGERLVTAIVRDVSDRKQLEEQYLQSQKMEALGRLASGVAHDFNNVLAAVMSQIELVKLDNWNASELGDKLDAVLQNCDRAATLTRQLLIFGRQQILEPRVVDVGDVVTGLEHMLRRIIGEDIELTVVRDSRSAPVLIDPGQLEQVIMNLVVNARDALPEGGQLRIEIGTEKPAEEPTEALQPGPGSESVTLDVIDSGCGMAPETLSRIFEPFFTTKPAGKGTGLGLSTVFGIVGKAKGHVAVESTPGRGSRFHISFPRSPLEPTTRGGGNARIEKGQGTVLVVEDDPSLCRATSAILERSGYRVLSATNAADALRQAERCKEPIDLLLSDVVMPRMGGRELAERLREKIPFLKTLFLSGYATNPGSEETLLPTPVLWKPVSAAELTAAVRRMIERGGKRSRRGAPPKEVAPIKNER